MSSPSSEKNEATRLLPMKVTLLGECYESACDGKRTRDDVTS
jgi:hypothetical protein